MAMEIIETTIFQNSVYTFAWDSETKMSMGIFTGTKQFQIYANGKDCVVRKHKSYPIEHYIILKSEKLEEYFRDVMETGEEIKEPFTE